MTKLHLLAIALLFAALTDLLANRFALLQDTGINLVHHFPEEAPFILMTDHYSGAGVCIGDIDSDGLPDVFLTNYNQGNRLYRNLGNWKFEDVTTQAGVTGDGKWSAGPAFIDIDNDADLDLFVCVYNAPNLLYLNDGKGKFTEAATSFGLDFAGASVMMAFADYDLDGDLDGYLLTHRMATDPRALKPLSSKAAFDRNVIATKLVDGKQQVEVTEAHRELFNIVPKGGGRIELISAGQRDRLYRNDGNGKFVDISVMAGIEGTDIGLGATWWDANGDLYPDLYVSNDYKGADRFYLNQRDGTFKEVARTALPHTPWLSMGSDFSDINNDGLLDFFATDMAGSTHYQQKVSMGDMEKDQWFLISSDPQQYMRNALYLNTGTHRFMEVAFLTGLAQSDWTWSPKFGDLDNDGWEDLFITNGMSRDFMNSDLARTVPGGSRSEAYREKPVLKQHNLAFRNEGDLRFSPAGEKWGLNQLEASYGAALGDLDRDGDLDLVVVNFDASVAVLRNDLGGNAVQLQLVGVTSNRMGLGARVQIGSQTKMLVSARGFMSANEPVLHFGLGKEMRADATIHWPSGVRQVVSNLRSGQVHRVVEPNQSPEMASEEPKTPWYERIQFSKMPAHRETPYNDYERQPLLPMKLSQLGPGLAVGDANGDGFEEVYLGGAAGQAGQLLVLGSTVNILTKPFEGSAASEDMGAVFFDADGDGDNDLYVVSGGVEGHYADRFYRNVGNGQFSLDLDALPGLDISGSGVSAADIDRDGDLDLFVGGRLVPGSYPESATSHLLVNEGGRFSTHPTFQLSGMVTSALWSDLNDDGWQDLLVAQEWGPIRCFINRSGNLTESTDTSGLSSLTGWWQGLASGDLDLDGDMDFVATNQGLNSKYHASAGHPLQLFYGDFDGSGRKRIVEAGFEGDILYPKRGKSCSTSAIPGLSKRFQTFHQFASASLAEIYGEDLKSSLTRQATTLESGVFLNDGSARFVFRPLPRLAQASPGFGVIVTPINDDYFPDIVMVQNNYSPQPETGHMDGGVGMVLTGKGDGTFAAHLPSESGFLLPGDAKALAITDWNRDGAPDLLASLNDGVLAAFQHQGTKFTAIEGLPIGTRVIAHATDGTIQTAEVSGGNSYLSQSTTTVYFASSENNRIHKLEVRYPNGTVEVVSPVPKGPIVSFPKL